MGGVEDMGAWTPETSEFIKDQLLLCREIALQGAEAKAARLTAIFRREQVLDRSFNKGLTQINELNGLEDFVHLAPDDYWNPRRIVLTSDFVA